MFNVPFRCFVSTYFSAIRFDVSFQHSFRRYVSMFRFQCTFSMFRFNSLFGVSYSFNVSFQCTFSCFVSMYLFGPQVIVTEEKDGKKVTKEKTVFDPFRLKMDLDTRGFSPYDNGGTMTQVFATGSISDAGLV